MPTISVVIPVYNGETTIKNTVRSVLNQTYTDFELIVINDGSTDSTLEILTEFQDPRIKIYSYTNAGLSTSRNRGIENSSGDFISFLDADDLWTSDKLEAQVKSLQDHPDAAVAYSWTDFIDNDGNLLHYGIYQTVNGYVFPDLIKFFFIGSGSNALIKKKVFDEVGGFDEKLTSAEDWDMFLRIAAKYQFTAITKPQILYRITENSMSRNVIRQEAECLKVINRAFTQEPGISFLHLRSSSYANLYIYLAAHALRGIPDRKKGLIASRFLWRAIKNEIFILKRMKLITVIICKIIPMIFLPAHQAQIFLNVLKSLKVHIL